MPAFCAFKILSTLSGDVFPVLMPTFSELATCPSGWNFHDWEVIFSGSFFYDVLKDVLSPATVTLPCFNCVLSEAKLIGFYEVDHLVYDGVCIQYAAPFFN